MALLWDSTRFEIPASTGNQDITISGFGGTPKAAIFFWTRAGSGDEHASEASMSIGFYDGTRDICFGCAFDDGSAGTAGRRFASNTSCGVIYNVGGAAIEAEFSGVQFISDGVRISVDDAGSAAYYVTVILIGGSAVSNVYCNLHDDLGTGTSPVAITAPAFAVDTLFATTVSWNSVVSGTISDVVGNLQFGVWDRSDATQRFVGMSNDSGANPSNVTNYSNSSNAMGQAIYTGVAWLGSVSTNVSGFNVTPSASAGSDIFGYLGIKWAEGEIPNVEIVGSALPSSATDWVENQFNFAPDWGMSCFSGTTSHDSNDSAPAPALMAVHTYKTGQILSAGQSVEDNVATSLATCWSAASFFHGDTDGTTALSSASLQSMNNDGWTVDLGGGTHDSTARVGWSLAIKAAPVTTGYLSMGGVIANP